MSHKVLIIDDSLDIHELVPIGLTGEPLEFFAEADGRDAVARALEIRPDLILLDVDMPDIDGFEVCRHLKADIRTASIPVIFLTGASLVNEKLKGLDLGAIDYVTKPFDPVELRARVRVALRTKSLLDQLTLLAALVESSQDAIVCETSDGRVLTWNGGATRLFGYTALEACGKDLSTLLPCQGPRGVATVRPAILRGERVHHFETQSVRKDGSPVQLSLSASPVRNNDGHVDLLGLIIRDITEQKRAEEALAESERFAHSVVDALTAHIAIVDQTGTILATNRAWRQFATDNGRSAASADVGRNYLEICDSTRDEGADDARATAEAIRRVIRGDAEQLNLEHACHSSNEKRWFIVRVSRFAGTGPVRVVVAHENVTERRLAAERLLHDSLHDALTGLPNRVLFADRVGQCIQHTRRHPESTFAVLFLDLDRFKVINDSLGHAAGDKLLVTIAERLRNCLREGDTICRAPVAHTVARLGGDEFTILLPNLPEAADAASVAERVLAAVAQPVEFDGHRIITTVSIGIVHVGGAHAQLSSAKDLMRDADIAMYEAKLAGKGRSTVFDLSMRQRVQARLNMENDLRGALAAGQLFLMYQPIVGLQTGQIESFEALLRWNHPERGLITPGEFIPVAEDTGLIVPIGQWVLREACRQFVSWQESMGDAAPHSISVNLSRIQLALPELTATIREVLERMGMPPGCLHLEVTESAVMKDTAAAAHMLRGIKDLGVKLDMDDFGTGYSSLACLQQFPIDVLKIDRSFIANINRGREFAALVHAVTQLAQNLNITVVAEGIETLQQLLTLQSLECAFGQGYLFSKPLMAEQVPMFRVRPGTLPGNSRSPWFPASEAAALQGMTRV